MHDAPTRLKGIAARGRPRVPEAQKALVRRFLRGEITFAQLEGLTAEEASRIAAVGHALFRRGRLSEAATVFEGLAAVNPLDPYAHQLLGAIAERQGRAGDALKHYDVSLSLRGGDPWVLARRGELRIRAGDPGGGAEDLARACAGDPEAQVPTTPRARLILQALRRAARRQGQAPRGRAP